MQEDACKGTAADPLSLNLYTYCTNNPITYIDPSGHAPTQTYVEGGITYTNVNGNIYKDGRLIPESNYQYIPTVIGGTRDGTPSNNSGGSPANTSNTGNNNNSGSNSGGTSYHMNSNGSITKTVNGQAYLVATNDDRYPRLLGELNAYIGNQTGQNLRTTVGVVINNGQVNWTSIGQPVTITQGDRLVATLNYNAKTGEYATSNKAVVTSLVNGSLTIKKATNNVKDTGGGSKSVVVVDKGPVGNLNAGDPTKAIGLGTMGVVEPPIFGGFLNPYLLSQMTLQDILSSIPQGWKATPYNNGQVIIVRDAAGVERIRIDPPQKGFSYDHVHLYDKNGNELDINLNKATSNKDADAHIRYNGPNTPTKKNDNNNNGGSGGSNGNKGTPYNLFDELYDPNEDGIFFWPMPMPMPIPIPWPSPVILPI